MKISETERKVLIAWLIIGILVFIAIVLINIRPKDKKVEEPNTHPGKNHVSDRIRYYTVKSAINKYYSYKNISDYDSVIKILDSSYVEENHIDEDTITTFIGESDALLTFDTGIMCLKSYKDGVYSYVVEGYEETMSTGEMKNKMYYQVTLDGNTSLFSLQPISESTYGGVCNE